VGVMMARVHRWKTDLLIDQSVLSVRRDRGSAGLRSVLMHSGLSCRCLSSIQDSTRRRIVIIVGDALTLFLKANMTAVLSVRRRMAVLLIVGGSLWSASPLLAAPSR